ncbi:uncharacterized protein LOC117125161 isoform X2 [Anneissia japonica]|uniref:uncharacterized protein LOC117125161 isoform X2 n=1 Tax=Anneissia japonica TaxID=1529436 RepID=UPI001425B962|nr:uncharacterized protein LOC117125161 isoform X2 [Anneissia japonica]
MSHYWWFSVGLMYISVRILCQALSEDDGEEGTRCSKKYSFFKRDVLNTDWIPLESSPCFLKAGRYTKKEEFEENAADGCAALSTVCERFKLNLLHINDETDRTFMENLSQGLLNQSHRLVYFDEHICKQMVYTNKYDSPFEKETLPLPTINLLICENITQDIHSDLDVLQTEAATEQISLLTPIYKAQKNQNSTSEVETTPQSSILMYICYALTSVAIVSAVLTLSVCCVRHQKKRTRTLDNSNYDAEYSLTVEQNTSHPLQREATDHTEPEIEPLTAPSRPKESKCIPEGTGPGQGSKTANHQNGDCGKGGQQLVAKSKSHKDIDKIGTANFPSGEYQDFAVELKSKVRRVLSNPTYVHGDDVIRSPIHSNPVTNKTVSSDNLSCLKVTESVAQSKEDMTTRKNQKHRPSNGGPCQSGSEQVNGSEEPRVQKSAEQRKPVAVSRTVDTSKYPATEPRDMSYMYVQLPKEWSKNIPIEEPTVPYASTDITKTIFKHVPSKSKPNGQGLNDDGVYETYDRRT